MFLKSTVTSSLRVPVCASGFWECVWYAGLIGSLLTIDERNCTLKLHKNGHGDFVQLSVLEKLIEGDAGEKLG